MNVPDYISPIVGWRIWGWDDFTPLHKGGVIRSLNGSLWLPGKAMEAACYAATGLLHDSSTIPADGCKCGIYAAKSLRELEKMGHHAGIGYPPQSMHAVVGEVWLWGRVAEHQYGYRAQYAYPKSINVPDSVLSDEVAAHLADDYRVPVRRVPCDTPSWVIFWY